MVRERYVSEYWFRVRSVKCMYEDEYLFYRDPVLTTTQVKATVLDVFHSVKSTNVEA